MSSTFTRSQPAMSPETFAMLGARRLAYVRAVRSEDVGFIYVEAPLLAPGRLVFVLHAADGTALVIAESVEAAIADAANQQLDATSVH
ncbi:MAG: DUF1150 family protein [Rhizobiales bacterium]|nr:DUF1150 family protein [Hyphomicrobiales bacterium]